MSIIEISMWARSAGGRNISLYKSEEKPLHPILLIGGTHGDEPEGVALAEATLLWLRYLSEQKNSLAPWIVIPCLNPDGFAKSDRTNGNGVDLNRNYPSRNWASFATQPRYNPGPYAASEPEVQALVSLIKSTTPRLIIHCHSWQPCIIYTGEPARHDANALGACSGYEVRDDIGYPTTGSLSQYGWHDNSIPIICIEEQEHTPLNEVWPHFESGLKKIFTDLSLRNVQERR